MYPCAPCLGLPVSPDARGHGVPKENREPLVDLDFLEAMDRVDVQESEVGRMVKHSVVKKRISCTPNKTSLET